MSARGILPVVKPSSFSYFSSFNEKRGSPNPGKEKGCRERLYTTNTRASTARDMISCSSSDLHLNRLLPLPSQVSPMTGFRRRGQNLDTYSTAQCGAFHPRSLFSFPTGLRIGKHRTFLLCILTSVSQIRSDLTVVAGTGGVTCDAYLGNHVHLQEGTENVGVIIDMVTSLGSWGPHSPEWCHPTD